MPQRFRSVSVAAEIVVRVCESGVMDEALERVGAEIAGFTARPVYGLSDVALRESAVALQRIVSQATAALSVVVREAQGRDLPGRDGAASTVSWLRDLLRDGGGGADCGGSG